MVHPAVFEAGQSIARRQRLRSRKMDRVRFRPRDGPAGDDFVRHSRYPFVRAERSAFSETIRMSMRLPSCPSEVRGIPLRMQLSQRRGIPHSLRSFGMTVQTKMKFSVNWLREFVELPTSIDELADLLTLRRRRNRRNREARREFRQGRRRANHGFHTTSECGSAEVCRSTTAAERTPDRLRREKLQGRRQSSARVCRAQNLPNGTKDSSEQTARRRIAKECFAARSNSAVAEDAAGLLILSPEAKIGAPIALYFPADTILDVEITPNRGDLLSHFGLAREIAALTEEARRRAAAAIEAAGEAPALQQDRRHDLCATRMSVLFRAPNRKREGRAEPGMVARENRSVGIRSINNIVDISNFVMLELGQPTHAFDADKLNGDINVRLARDGEKFLALDGKTYSLTPDDLVIADRERAVGIGGVMGGEETGVTESTKNVLLESRLFFAGEHSTNRARFESAERCELPIRARVDPQMILAGLADGPRN